MLKNNLAKIRQKKGLNQRQLAEAIHTPQSLVSSVEKGRRVPWPKLVNRLCEVLQVTSEELFPSKFNK